MDPIVQQFLGVIVALSAACCESLGLNTQKRDHLVNNNSKKQRRDCFRLNWHLGLYLYVIGQAVGGSLVLLLLKAAWVAPLSATTLIFNAIFARYLVGLSITWRDIGGTLVIMASILAIILTSSFAGPQHTSEDNLSLETLKALFTGEEFKIYFAVLNAIIVPTFIVCFVCIHTTRTVESFKGSFLGKYDRDLLRYKLGMIISALGGVFASETLVLTKSSLKILIESFTGNFQLGDPAAIGILLALALSGFLHIFCLTTGLKLANNVVGVPLFFSVYNVFSLINSMTYFAEWQYYAWWPLVIFAGSLLFLIAGIILLAGQVKIEPTHVPQLACPFSTCTHPNINEEEGTSPIPNVKPTMDRTESQSTTDLNANLTSSNKNVNHDYANNREENENTIDSTQQPSNVQTHVLSTSKDAKV